MNINHISISRAALFNECEEKYKFRYHLETPSQLPEPVYFSYGKTIHRIAELVVQSGDFEQFNEIVNDVMSGKVEIQEGQKAPKLDAEYSRKLIQHLKNLRSFIMKMGLKEKGYTEYKFEYDLMPPNNYLVTGFIDRIVIKDNKYFIIDYKTTKKGPWRQDKVSVLGDLQLRTYANVIHRNFGIEPKNIHCCLCYLDGSQYDIVGATYSKKSLEDAEKELLDVYIQIKDTKPEDARGTVGEHCRRCDYAKICKWRKLT